MAGIYIHIPFCKQACHYCNFHFSTSLKYKSAMVMAILQEIELQKDYLNGEPLSSIYFGGGTPSLLDTTEIIAILQQIQRFHTIAPNIEITLEANPDDLNAAKLDTLAQTPINRLSIGIQSFNEADLMFMNRAHNAQEANRCISLAQSAGFQNLTIDLIYGAPTTTDEVWKTNVDKALAFGIPHISCYCLTVEPNTALAHFVKMGKATPVDEEQSNRQFQMLMETLEHQGYIHYEISNFAQPDQFAVHNTNYWKGVPYLGIGPSAHSFNNNTRQWNVANNAKYLSALQQKTVPYEMEILTTAQRYNEYVMTSLRTIWGCQVAHLQTFGMDYSAYFLKKSQIFLQKEWMKQKEDTFSLTQKGKLLADYIAMELFWED
ncbi:MAG: radical SAM family heme chaperone HemW [Saprospiraceae bacterium]|nr:radical SAM family heme chaperone HemW [Saprospiraceae bacterium]